MASIPAPSLWLELSRRVPPYDGKTIAMSQPFDREGFLPKPLPVKAYLTKGDLGRCGWPDDAIASLGAPDTTQRTREYFSRERAHEALQQPAVLESLRQHTLVSVPTMKARGWSEGLISRFLGAPDVLVDNPHYKTAHAMRLYRVGRIEEAERDPAWARAQAVSGNRSQSSRRSYFLRKSIRSIVQQQRHARDMAITAEELLNAYGGRASLSFNGDEHTPLLRARELAWNVAEQAEKCCGLKFFSQWEGVRLHDALRMEAHCLRRYERNDAKADVPGAIEALERAASLLRSRYEMSSERSLDQAAAVVKNAQSEQRKATRRTANAAAAIARQAAERESLARADELARTIAPFMAHAATLVLPGTPYRKQRIRALAEELAQRASLRA